MILTACSNAQPQAEMPTVGGETDAHGCLPSAGQSYSYLKKPVYKCLMWRILS